MIAQNTTLHFRILIHLTHQHPRTTHFLGRSISQQAIPTFSKAVTVIPCNNTQQHSSLHSFCATTFKMAPTSRSLSSASIHLNSFQKRDHEHTIWIAMGAVVGVFAFVVIIAISISCFRTRKQKQMQQLAKKRESITAAKGKYTKLDDERHSVEHNSHAPRSLASSSKPRSRSSSRGSDSKPMLRQSMDINNVPMHDLDKRRYHDSADYGINPPSFEESTGHERNSLFLPPPPAPVVQTQYTRQYDRSRSPSPAPLVLSRSITMLRPSSQLQTKAEMA